MLRADLLVHRVGRLLYLRKLVLQLLFFTLVVLNFLRFGQDLLTWFHSVTNVALAGASPSVVLVNVEDDQGAISSRREQVLVVVTDSHASHLFGVSGDLVNFI